MSLNGNNGRGLQQQLEQQQQNVLGHEQIQIFENQGTTIASAEHARVPSHQLVTGFNEMSSDHTYKYWQRKEKAIDTLLCSVNTVHWNFQKQVDHKARNHLKNLLMDNWEPVKTHTLNPLAIFKRKDKNAENIVTDEELQHQLERSLKKIYHEMMREYKRWCLVTSRNRGTKSTDPIIDQVAAMLLLLMIFGEIDLVRSQNHTCLLLFHTSLRISCSESYKQLMNDASKTTQDSADIELQNLRADEYEYHNNNSHMKKKHRVFVEDDKTIGGLVRKEARIVYNLMSHMFDTNKRNDEFFDWDDLNDLCWTPGFVNNFLKCEDQSGQDMFTIGGFNKALRLKKYPLLNTLTSMSQDQGMKYIKTEGIQSKLEKEKYWFKSKWKTYFDRAGGWLGWKGYVTFFINWSAPIYFQLFCLTVALGWLFNFQFTGGITNYVYAGVTGFPLVLMVLYFLVKHVFLRWWTNPLPSHPHYWTIPRRDTLYRDSELNRGFCFFNFIQGHILKYFHLRHLISVSMIILVAASYIVFMRWALFEAIRSITIDTIDITVQLATGEIDSAKLTGIDIGNLVITYLVFTLLWISTLFVCGIMVPILLQIWVGIYGFVRGLQLQVNKVNCWADLRRCFMDKRLILDNFRKKMLAGADYKDNDLIECSFATVWNAILEDFYENHQLSKDEKDRFSYTIKAAGNTVQIVKRPDLLIRPVNHEVRHHLIKFVNNLYMRSMPWQNVRIMDMKKLVIFTPIFKEKIYYSWEELVKPGNTNSSFLRALIMKYPEDWKNFKDRQFPPGNRLRVSVDYIEAKVLAGIDITSHKVHASITTHFMKNMIRSWASQRFQPVSRTVKGFMKIPKAMSILLRLQNPELSDEEVRQIVRQKFSYVCGAQLYDKKMWNQATKHDSLSPKEQKRNIQEHREYLEGLDELCKSIGDSMLKIAFIRQHTSSDINNPQNKVTSYSSVLRTFNGDSTEDMYEVDCFGNFSRVGQGKPTNQGFMVQFFDGSYCQAIDCNMDSTLCQSLFVPNVLKEFDLDSRVKMVGFPEYITTKTWSKAGYAAAFTERVFGSMVQRVWNMIGLRFHYGHPDIMRGLFIMFTSGLSKLSYISEDIFNGFDCMLNNGISKHVDYMEVGKARDVCMISTTKFNRKIAGGGAQVACSRYPRLLLTSRHLTFTDKLLFCYSVIAHYSNTTLTIAAAFFLYFSRQIMLLAVFIYLKFNPFDKVSKIGAAADSATESLRIVADSLFLFQIGMALSFPGILQCILDRGVLRGLYEYISNFVWLLIYSMFQLMNTCFYFHNGFSNSAQYIASGRVTGLQHTTIIDTWRMFRSTHFYPAIILILLQIIGFITDTSWYFAVYHGCLIFIWCFSPFLFNTGALPFDVSTAVWKQLYAEDLFRIKVWIRNNCKIENVETVMQRNRHERHMGLEYEYIAEDRVLHDHLELDLEMGMGGSDEQSFKTKRKSLGQLPLLQLQSNMQQRKVDMKEKKKNKKNKKHNANQEDRQAPTANETLVRYGKRRRIFHFIFVQPFLVIKYVIHLIPKLILLLVLYITKLISYLILLYKIIAPWTSPPDYLVAYQEQYHVKITESRLMNIQRLFGKFKEDILLGLPNTDERPVNGYHSTRRRRRLDVNSGASCLAKHTNIARFNWNESDSQSTVSSSSSAISTSPMYLKTTKEAISRLNAIKATDGDTYESLVALSKDIGAEESKSEQTLLYQRAIQDMLIKNYGIASNREFADLCAQCSHLTFAPRCAQTPVSLKERERRALVDVMALLHLFYHLHEFQISIKTAVDAVSAILKSNNRDRFEKAAFHVVQTGRELLNSSNRDVFNQIMISDNPERKKINKLMRAQLSLLMGQVCKIAEVQMQEAKSYFRNYTVKENQNDLWYIKTNASTPTAHGSLSRHNSSFNNKCHTCELIQELMKIRGILEKAINFATRITEKRPSETHTRQYQSAKTSNTEESDVIVGDNGLSLFDQIFPLYDSTNNENYLIDSKYTQNRVACVNKGLLFDDMYQSMLSHINAKIFANLENDCHDMLDYLDKRRKELTLHDNCTRQQNRSRVHTTALNQVFNRDDNSDDDDDDNMDNRSNGSSSSSSSGSDDTRAMSRA